MKCHELWIWILALSCFVLIVESVLVGIYAPDRYDGIPDICLMPMDSGYCKAKVKRYYFDTRRMKCSVFYWGGCAGNINNFKSLDECNKVCLDSLEADHDIGAVSPGSSSPKERKLNNKITRKNTGSNLGNKNINKDHSISNSHNMSNKNDDNINESINNSDEN